MQVIKRNLKEAHDRKKIYVDQHRALKDFMVGEHVHLNIKLKRISLRIESCSKLTPWYYGSFEILERIGQVAYRLSLPPIVKVCDAFHVSLLKRYVKVEIEEEFYPKPQCIL